MVREPFRPLPGGSDRPAHTALLLAFGLAVLALAGCQSDEITKYRVPREQKPMTRLLGAIIPHGDKTWSVKLAGPEETVKEQEGAFDQFVKSIRFLDKGGEPITWTVPAGWQRQAGAKMGRFATFEVGPKEHPLEATVYQLGGAGAASVLANVNRWRGNLGLRPVGEEDLGKITHEVDVDGTKATVVALTGRGSGKMALRQRPVEERPGDHEPALAQPKLTYKLPEGWKEAPPNQFSVLGFSVKEGDEEAKVTVTPMGGGLLLNVNRWRDQVGLPRIGEAQLLKDVQRIKVAGEPAAYLDLAGPKREGRPGRRILGVILPREGRAWFFKMDGPVDLVGRQKAAFEAFVTSVQFPGGGGNDE